MPNEKVPDMQGFADLAQRMDEMVERRDIQRAMLGPDRPAEQPTRVWSEDEAERFAGRGSLRRVRECESYRRGYEAKPGLVPAPGEHLPPEWPAGPWDTEPDRLVWSFLAVPGMALLINRNRLGAWCGYVALPPGHVYYGREYGDVPVDVHGGLTFADRCHERICHAPKPGEPEEVWWLGFDCLHFLDTAPGMLALRSWTGSTGGSGWDLDLPPYVSDVYRDIGYAMHETEDLALQLVAAHEASRCRIERAMLRAVRHRARMMRRELRRARREVAA